VIGRHRKTGTVPQHVGFEQEQSVIVLAIPEKRGTIPFSPQRRGRSWARFLFGLIVFCSFSADLCATPARADAVGPAGEGAAAPAVRTARGWAAMSGSDLKGTLDGWSRAAGWTLVWDSQVNYRLRASAQFAGDFETAVASLVDTIHRSNPEVLVTLYRGNRVVHVETTLVETR
jgi:type IV pili sensor histidine kinase/response regulator